jgi:DNA-binding CsgD family transcriptional regulator
VFNLLVDGIRPKDIAKQLEISPKTVDTYRAKLMRKLEINSIAGLVRFAMTRGMRANGKPDSEISAHTGAAAN